MNISAVSMREIYLNPTIEKLAAHLDTLQPEEGADDDEPAVSNEDTFYYPSYFSYVTCGVFQLAWILGWAALAVWIFVECFWWANETMPNYQETYIRLLGLSVGLIVFFSLLPVFVKWLVIGRWTPQKIPVWSLRYFVFWAMKDLIAVAPIAYFGEPFYNLYLRMLGARVGRHTVISPKSLPSCPDLLSIGSGTVVSRDAIINGYKAQSNYIHIGPITIGDNAYVGEAAVLDIDTEMGDGTQLGHASALRQGQRVPDGKHYHGTPAQETTADYCQIEPRGCSSFRRWMYALVPLVVGLAVAPLVGIAGLWAFPYVYDYLGGEQFAATATYQSVALLAWRWIWVSFSIYVAAIILGLIYIGTVPRVMNLFLTEDRTYKLYGFHYFVHRFIERTTNSEFYNNIFGDSSYIVYYMRWIGWELNTIIQSGSNFGSDQRHDNPFLCDIGTGTMVSGGLKMINETMSSSSFKLNKVRVGDHNYLGNYLHIPADSKVGDNVLMGTKMLVPIDGPVRENVGLLGSPSFEIPRAAQRDLEMGKMDEETRLKRISQKNRYNIVSSTLFMLNTWFVGFLLTFIVVLAILYSETYGMLSLYGGMVVAFLVVLAWMWFVERWSLLFGTLEPRIVLLLDRYYWFHERHKLVSLLHEFEDTFAGTPFKNILSRIEGVKVGKMVFDDGFEFNEYTLIEVGDYCNLNENGLIQPHTLEEGVFKSDYVTIGKGCSLGSACNLHYGVTFGDYVVLEQNAFVMKGETADANTTWRGNPARAVGERAPRITPPAEPAPEPEPA